MNEQNNVDQMAVGNKNTMFGRVERHVQSKTMGGLIELLPLLVTIMAATFIVSNVDAFVRPLPFVSGQPWDFPGIGFIAMVVIFYVLGLFVSMRLGRKLMDWNYMVQLKCHTKVWGVWPSRVWLKFVLSNFLCSILGHVVLHSKYPRISIITRCF